MGTVGLTLLLAAVAGAQETILIKNGTIDALV